MTWRPLRGRVIVTRVTQVTSDVLIIPDSYKDERSVRTADRGVVLAAGLPPSKGVTLQGAYEGYECGVFVCEPLKPGDEVFYLGPAEKLAIEWEGQTAYAVTYEEVLGVIV